MTIAITANLTNDFEALHSGLVRARESGRIFLMILHADPASRLAGGTERQTLALATMLAKQQHTVVTVFPARNETLRICCDSLDINIVCHRDSLAALMPLFESSVDVLHVQHTLGWTEANQTILAHARIPHKIVSLHDYYFICPSINLLKAPDGLTFCGVEREMAACNRCLQQFHGFRSDTIEEYRQKKSAFLRAFDHILLPSASMRSYLEAAFGINWDELGPKCHVLPHDLASLRALAVPQQQPVPDQKRIVFIGALNILKGSQLIAAAIPALTALDYEVEIWGKWYGTSRQLKQVKQRSFTQSHELRELLIQYKPALTVFASLTAETFSFAFYEALILGNGAVPVVSQFGHPASIVRETGIGLVLPEMTAAALVQTCIRAEQQYPTLLAAKQKWLVDWWSGESADYLAKYMGLLDGQRPREQFDSVLDWQELYLVDQQRLAAAKKRQWRQILQKVFSLMRSKYTRPYYMRQLIAKTWHILKSEGINGIKDRMNRLS